MNISFNTQVRNTVVFKPIRKYRVAEGQYLPV